MIPNAIKTIILLILLTALSACKSTEEFVIKDLIELNQNHKNYSKDIAHINLIPAGFHKELAKEYKSKFLAPWYLKKASINKEKLARYFTSFANKKGFAENKQPLEKNWIAPIKDNARIDKFPNYIKHGITISNTNLRLLPTTKPHFSAFTDHANGFPFDNLQNSSLAANTPILITHITKDNAWVYVETAFAQGWAPIRDIAYVDKAFKKKFKSYSKYIAAVDDDFPIKTSYGTYLFQGYIGMVFPFIKESKQYYHVAVPMASSRRYAYIKEALIPKQSARYAPIRATVKNIAWLSNKLTNKAYGWGGMYKNRDCSAMIRDLYTPFGIWLPRNSASQAKKGGTFITIKDLTDEQKKTFILENAQPYFSLLWFPGHIMLYIGDEKGEPLVFHNIWGIRTNTAEKRKIIGKSVITTLTPGKESKHVDENASFLSLLEGITLLGQRY